ncbi:MAG: M23 family metallopeptidase [Negativicutes bacterium]|nr:M23 family metallopeptidase [Negativicutes bacterium]
MARGWNKWKNRGWGESRDTWITRDHRAHYRYGEESGYRLLKKTLIALIIFATVYGLHMTDTRVSRAVDDSVRYILTAQTDFSTLGEELAKYAPKGFDQSVLKRVQGTVSKPADPLLYMTKPVDGKIVMPYGWQTHPVLKQEMMHEGISIEAQLGASIRAAAPGKVKAVAESARHGRTIVIDHGRDIETTYGHIGEILVKPDESVSQGQVIARVGKTGITNGPMLYFEVREKGNPVDPLLRVRGEFTVKEGK